jgi:hypothetical protein
VTRSVLLASLLGLAALSACDRGVPERQNGGDTEPEPQTIDVPQTVAEMAPGTTPMADRVAVLGLLNKRNGISRDLELKPGEAVRVGDVIVRLRACETTAPWEVQQLTGAFVQVDVRNPQGQFQRVFSGWLYKESPSLNVVEHPVYDVWPKSCAMTHPEAAPSAVREGSTASNRSSAPNSGAEEEPPPPAVEPAPEPAPATEPEPEPAAPAEPVGGPANSADDSIEM